MNKDSKKTPQVFTAPGDWARRTVTHTLSHHCTAGSASAPPLTMPIEHKTLKSKLVHACESNIAPGNNRHSWRHLDITGSDRRNLQKPWTSPFHRANDWLSCLRLGIYSPWGQQNRREHQQPTPPDKLGERETKASAADTQRRVRDDAYSTGCQQTFRIYQTRPERAARHHQHCGISSSNQHFNRQARVDSLNMIKFMR